MLTIVDIGCPVGVEIIFINRSPYHIDVAAYPRYSSPPTVRMLQVRECYVPGDLVVTDRLLGVSGGINLGDSQH